MRVVLTLAAGFLSLSATGALANSDVPDPYASEAIARGDYGRAERILVAYSARHPDRPEAQLNLATVYARTGRIGEARALYQAVLARPDVRLAISSDLVFGSHQLARAALARLDGASDFR